MTTLVALVLEFLKTGLFAVGGGLATLPFLYQMADRYSWFSTEMLVNMIAISESTPGPIGINMATYAGFLAAGVVGSLAASLSVALPGVCISIAVARGYKEYKDNRVVQDAFYAIRPVVAALIAHAALNIMGVSLLVPQAQVNGSNFFGIFNWFNILVFVILLVLTNKCKAHPVIFIAASAAVGLMFQL